MGLVTLRLVPTGAYNLNVPERIAAVFLLAVSQSSRAGSLPQRVGVGLEFAALQEKLQVSIRFFDSLVRTEQHNSNMAIRLVNCGEAKLANSIAIELANQGFLTSAVFFPVVAQGKAAIRITLRADMETTLIRQFCELISELSRTHGRDIGS